MKKLFFFPLFFFFFVKLFSQSPGSLDQSFGNGGTVLTDFQNEFNTSKLVFLQPDGKIILLGNTNISTNVLALRYMPDGTLDNSFGNAGIFKEANFGLAAGTIIYSELWSGALQPDGKILMAGIIHRNNFNMLEMFIIRVNENGTKDNTFGTNGIFRTTLQNDVEPYGKIIRIALLQSGDIIAFTSHRVLNKFTLLKITASGALDTGFGNNGVFEIPTSYNPLFNVYPEALIVQPDGKILAHGVAANNPGNTYRGYLFRYFPDGTPDTSLDGDGELVFSDVSYGGLNNTDQRSLVVMPNGKMLVMHGGITRYNANGSLDTSFGNNGSAVTGINLYSFLYQSDGKILCTGTTNSRAALLRFNANGSVDGGFGNSGGGYADLPPTSRYSHLLQQPDGKIVTCGNKDNDFLLGRHFSQTINSNTREPAFDPKVSVSPNPSQGVLTVEFELNEAQAVALVLYDLSGRQLRSLMAPTQLPEGVFSRIFHLTDVPSGTYLLQIRGQEGEKSCVISLH